MKDNNLIIMERDVFCPYCNQNSAVLISETVKKKWILGCAPVGCKDGCLLMVTGGCWAVVSGLPLFDYKMDYTTNLFGFCPCCGNTYPVIKPQQEEKTVIDRFNDTKAGFSRLAGQAKGMFGGGNNNQPPTDQYGYNDPNNNNGNQY